MDELQQRVYEHNRNPSTGYLLTENYNKRVKTSIKNKHRKPNKIKINDAGKEINLRSNVNANYGKKSLLHGLNSVSQFANNLKSDFPGSFAPLRTFSSIKSIKYFKGSNNNSIKPITAIPKSASTINIISSEPSRESKTSRITKRENLTYLSKIRLLTPSNEAIKNLELEYGRTISDEKFNQIFKRINFKDFEKIGTTFIIEDTIYHVNMKPEFPTYYCIKAKGRIKPLKFMVNDLGIQKIVIYTSSYYRKPYRNKCSETLFDIKDGKTYKIFVGEKDNSKFLRDNIYITMESTIEFEFRIKFCFGDKQIGDLIENDKPDKIQKIISTLETEITNPRIRGKNKIVFSR